MSIVLLILVPAIFAAWTPPVSTLGGEYTSAFGVASWGGNHYDLFVKGTDNALFHRRWTSEQTWSSEWESLGGVITSKPAAISWKPETVAVFARGTDDAIWVKWYESEWKDWFSLGMPFLPDGIKRNESLGAPTVCSWGPKRIDLFVRGIGNALWHTFWTGGAPTEWSNWEFLGGRLASNPSCVSWGENRIDIVARDTKNLLVHLSWIGKVWSRWTILGRLGATENPIIASMRKRYLNLFVRKPDGHLKMKSYNYYFWSPFWQRITNLRTDYDPAVVSAHFGHLRIMLIHNGIQYHTDFTSTLPVDVETTLEEVETTTSGISYDVAESPHFMNENGLFVPNALVGVVVAVATIALVVVAGLIVTIYKWNQ